MEALSVLQALGLPPEQQNDRSALTLLALLNLNAAQPWTEASSHLIGVTPIMEFIRREYGRKYAPNTRETIRRFTLHQFVHAGLVRQNPDVPERPTNSPRNVYEIEPSALTLLKSIGTDAWPDHLEAYLKDVPALRTRYAAERKINRIPLTLPEGQEITLTPGGQNPLVKEVVENFCSVFTPGAVPVYVGDTGDKWAFFDRRLLGELNVMVEEHGKIPDVLVYLRERNWLVMIEAVTSHGPMSPKRVQELKSLFTGCSAGLVFVTAFPDAKTYMRYFNEIAWETEVWLASAPTHMIHFNGERFLGPYEP